MHLVIRQVRTNPRCCTLLPGFPALFVAGLKAFLTDLTRMLRSTGIVVSLPSKCLMDSRVDHSQRACNTYSQPSEYMQHMVDVWM